MPNVINATSTGNGGLVSTGDDSGILNIQTNETTAITVDASQIVSYTNNLGTVAGYPAYQCRAWVNFNGTGTVAIRASGNVSSITDSGTGDYTVNFTTAMPDVNFVCEVSAYDSVSGATAIKIQPYRTVSTSSQPLVASNAAGTATTDLNQIHVAIFR